MLKSIKIREGHDNFFTPLRLVFAVLVMLGHASAIAMRDPNMEPQIIFHYTFSYLAVNLFFIASGFLVTGSMLFRGDGAGFVSARALRIYPALIVHVLFVMFIIGPLATSLPLFQFFTDSGFWAQPLMVLTFFETSMSMPGIFESNGEQFGSVPLWTLRFEILCYIATLLAFSIGLMKRKWMVLAQFILPSIGWIVSSHFGLFEHLPASYENILRFGIAYGLGATIFAYKDRLNFSLLALPVLVGLTWLTHSTPIIEVTINLLLAWFVMTVAYVRLPALNILKKLPDVSYGIYIYHWAVLQILFMWMPHLSTVELFTLGLFPVVGISLASWYLVEKPMLNLKTRFGNWLRRTQVPKAYKASDMLLD